MSQAETRIQQEILLRLGARRGVRVFRMNTGKARDPATGQVVTFGVPGMADVLVLVRDRYVWLEVKTAAGRLSEPQRNFQAAVRSIGGVCEVVRSADEADGVIACLLP